MNRCEVKWIDDGERWRCPVCDRPARRPLSTPIRECLGAPAEPLVYNDLSAGPCIHRGETLREEPCEFCGHRDKLVPIFACNSPDRPAAEVSEARWAYKQPRRETCGGCASYEPVSAAGTSDDRPARDASDAG